MITEIKKEEMCEMSRDGVAAKRILCGEDRRAAEQAASKVLSFPSVLIFDIATIVSTNPARVL